MSSVFDVGQSSHRHLLYHRGIDESSGTYITNYIFGPINIITGILLLIWYFRNSKIHNRSLCTYSTLILAYIPNLTIQTSLLAIYIGLSFLFGAIVHHLYPHSHKYASTPLGYHIFWRLSLIAYVNAPAHLLLVALSIFYGDTNINQQRHISCQCIANIIKCQSNSKQPKTILILPIICIILSIFVIVNPVLIIGALFFVLSSLILVICVGYQLCKQGCSSVLVFVCLGVVIQVAGASFQAAFSAGFLYKKKYKFSDFFVCF